MIDKNFRSHIFSILIKINENKHKIIEIKNKNNNNNFFLEKNSSFLINLLFTIIRKSPLIRIL